MRWESVRLECHFLESSEALAFLLVGWLGLASLSWVITADRYTLVQALFRGEGGFVSTMSLLQISNCVYGACGTYEIHEAWLNTVWYALGVVRTRS